MASENRVSLLTSAFLAEAAPRGCPESGSRFLHPDRGSERITYEDYNGGRTLNVKCSGANSPVCNNCNFRGRGRIIGGNV